MNKRNILLIMTDQHRRDCLGCYGNPEIETPNLDWLASQGTVFERAYSPSPSCVPARACLMTGMNPWNTGVLGMGRGQKGMGNYPVTIASLLAQAGYHTQGVGKMHFRPQRALLGFHNTVLDESGRVQSPGFESDYRRWFNENKGADYEFVEHGIDWNSWIARPYPLPEYLHPTNWTAREAIRFLDRRDPNRPFFLKLSFARPHSPYDPPEYFFRLYENRTLPAPVTGEWDAEHRDADASAPDAWHGKHSDRETARARQAYYGSITHLDQQIGRVLMYLKKKGLLEDTLILFTSDHGDMLGDHYLWRKTYAYEGSAGIPLIVRLPESWGETRRSRCSQPVTLQDILPTFMEAVGLPIPDGVDGRSLLPLMRAEDCAWREYLHGEHSANYSESQEMQYLTDGQWKYIWFPRTGREQLFDLRQDPGERFDLAGKPAYLPELGRWRSRLVAELEPRGLGLTEGGELVCQAGRPPIVSPNCQKYRVD
ncbi:MAG: arylsulfatase [Provencibacterium sp.]|nr:arylsulfatase [Provencibacterium sp.]